jgi:hypothetical protein
VRAAYCACDEEKQAFADLFMEREKEERVDDLLRWLEAYGIENMIAESRMMKAAAQPQVAAANSNAQPSAAE